jgi:hypothetical protein
VTTSPLPDSTRVVAAGDLLVTEFGAELVVLNLRDGVYYGLENVGARIWTLLQEPVTVAAICDAIVSEYDVEPVCCAHDTRALLGELTARGLVEVREHP